MNKPDIKQTVQAGDVLDELAGRLYGLIREELRKESVEEILPTSRDWSDMDPRFRSAIRSAVRAFERSKYETSPLARLAGRRRSKNEGLRTLIGLAAATIGATRSGVELEVSFSKSVELRQSIALLFEDAFGKPITDLALEDLIDQHRPEVKRENAPRP